MKNSVSFVCRCYMVAMMTVAAMGTVQAQCMENVWHRYPTTFTQHGDTLVQGVTLGEETMKINYS